MQRALESDMMHVERRSWRALGEIETREWRRCVVVIACLKAMPNYVHYHGESCSDQEGPRSKSSFMYEPPRAMRNLSPHVLPPLSLPQMRTALCDQSRMVREQNSTARGRGHSARINVKCGSLALLYVMSPHRSSGARERSSAHAVCVPSGGMYGALCTWGDEGIARLSRTGAWSERTKDSTHLLRLGPDGMPEKGSKGMGLARKPPISVRLFVVLVEPTFETPHTPSHHDMPHNVEDIGSSSDAKSAQSHGVATSVERSSAASDSVGASTSIAQRLSTLFGLDSLLGALFRRKAVSTDTCPDGSVAQQGTENDREYSYPPRHYRSQDNREMRHMMTGFQNAGYWREKAKREAASAETPHPTQHDSA